MGLKFSVLARWKKRFVGQDSYGNKYYEDKKCRRDGKIHRWVNYKGDPEASKVPCEWHRWLHYTTDIIPHCVVKHSWEKPHIRNLSGTVFAYNPSKSLTDKNKSYTAWIPEE